MAGRLLSSPALAPAGWLALLLLPADPASAQFCGVLDLDPAPDVVLGNTRGGAVAIEGEWALVGDPIDGLGAGLLHDRVFVRRRDEGGPSAWGATQTLTQPGGFGSSLALSESRAIVSAPSDGTEQEGAVWIYELDGTAQWQPGPRIGSPSGAAFDGFGAGSVALDGDVAVASGAYSQASVRERNAGGADQWGEVANLVPGGSGIGVYSADLEGDTLVLGNWLLGSGVVVVYERDPVGPTWVVRQTLSGSDASFGRSVSLSGDHLAVGGLTDGVGEVRIFRRDAGGPDNWGEVAVVSAPPERSSVFGGQISLRADRLLTAGRGREPLGLHRYHRHFGGADAWGLVDVLPPPRPLIGPIGGFVEDFWPVAQVRDTILMGDPAYAQADAEFGTWGASFFFTPDCFTPLTPGDITVTNTADAGAGSLRSAILQANAQPGLDIIRVITAGTIALESALPTLTESVDLSGPGPALTTIDGQDQVGRLLTVGLNTGGESFQVEGLTFTGAFEAGDGAALYLAAGNDLALTDCVFTANEAVGNGGALRSNGSLDVRDCVFHDNQAGNIGGAIYAADGDLSVRSSTFTQNRNPSRGGAIIAGVDTLIEDTTLAGNDSIEGGGLYFSDATLTIRRSHFDDNQADRGAGLYLRCFGVAPCATVTIESSTFSNNRALGASAAPGGGLHGLGVDLDVESSTFSGNQSLGDGGGLSFTGDTRVRLVNLTIASNSAGDGGGIAASSGLIVREMANNLIGNNLPNDCDRDLGTSDAHNLSSDTSCGFDGPQDSEGRDPLLAALSDGGPAPDHALLPGSPAIDAGDDATCTPFDQRGEARIRACDLGAVEFLPEPGVAGACRAALGCLSLLAVRRSSPRGRPRTAA